MLARRWKMVFLSACLLAGAAAHADGTPAIKSETLLQSMSSWDNRAYKAYPPGAPELSIVKITIPPHTSMDWHTHPMPNIGYVLSGDVTVEKKSGEKRHFNAGEALPETIDTVHRGVTGDNEAVLIVFYAGAKGMPLSQPEQPPADKK